MHIVSVRGASGRRKPACAAAFSRSPHRGARKQRGVYVASARGCAAADARRFDRQCRGTRPAAAAREPGGPPAVFAGYSAARKPDIRNPQCQGPPDRPYQHHRAGVGARQPERRGVAAGGACRGKSCGGDSRFAQGAQSGQQPLFPGAASGGRLCRARRSAAAGTRCRGLREPLFCQLRHDFRAGRSLRRGAGRSRCGGDLRQIQDPAGLQPCAGRFALRRMELHLRQQELCLRLPDGQAGAGRDSFPRGGAALGGRPSALGTARRDRFGRRDRLFPAQEGARRV